MFKIIIVNFLYHLTVIFFISVANLTWNEINTTQPTMDNEHNEESQLYNTASSIHAQGRVNALSAVSGDNNFWYWLLS